MRNGPGPTWLGIGAQRSGTTWLTDLLLQHPDVCLAPGETKELHAFDTAVVDGWTDDDSRAYRARFTGAAASNPGEFTPYYLRAPWVPSVARRACGRNVTVIVILRDPVARFASAMRWYEHRRSNKKERTAFSQREWLRDRTADAIWGGMYAAHLRMWAAVFDPHQLLVLQYEQARAEPQKAVNAVWARLGLSPVGLRDVGARSRTATADVGAADDHWGVANDLRARLGDAYRRDVAELEASWGIDPAWWPSVG